MAILPPSVDYTDKDFDALRARLIALVKSVFPDWSDFSVASFGNVLLEMYAFVGDVVTYYLDAQARESRLVTATQRKNVIALARMLGYRLHGARAATAEIAFTLARPPTADLVIPAGTVVRTREVTEPVRFQLLADVLIPAGSDPPVAVGVVENSQTHTQLFDARGLADLDVILDRTPYLDGSASVSAANGAYTEEESLLGSGPNDRHFLVLVDQNDRATIRFGNGTSGAPPSGTISVTYKTGGGSGGNVEAGSLVVIEGVFNDAHGRPAQVSVINLEPASGGADRQSVASAKLLAPESLRTLTRTVTREDFEINARRVPGVARALMLTSNEDASIGENSDFEGWPRLFKDVKRAEVKRRTATEAIVEFESRTLGHSHTLRIQTGDPNRTRFEVTDGHGIELSGEFSLEPITEGVTRIRGHLHNKATGFFGWFVSDASVREKREAKLRHDLQDLHTRFGRAR